MGHQKNQIHPTAIIGPHVMMGVGNEVGPNVILDGEIQIGNRNLFEAGVVMTNRISIGDSNHFYPYVTVGYLGEMGAKGDRFVEDGRVEIGNSITIREYVNVHSPVRTRSTVIEDHCYIMNKCYLAHDVRIGHHAILSAGVLLGGRCEVGHHANLGMGVAVHHRICIGQAAMIGMNTPVTSDVLPYAVVAGSPARILRFNRLGAERSGVENLDLDEIESRFRELVSHSLTLDHQIISEIRLFLDRHPHSLMKFKK